MKKTINSFLIGVIAGTSVYIISLLLSLLAYCKLSSITNTVLFVAGLLLGVFTAAVSLIYKNLSAIQAACRWLIMVGSYILALVLNGYIGTVRLLHEALKIASNSAADNVSGMLMLTMIFVVCGTSLVTFLILLFSKGEENV